MVWLPDRLAFFRHASVVILELLSSSILTGVPLPPSTLASYGCASDTAGSAYDKVACRSP